MSAANAGRLALWPSIDLRGGRVVRLLRGEWDAVTTFDADPVEVARTFEREGADGLHVVDLDAAFGKGSNKEEILRVRRAVAMPMQVGGGMRSAEAVEDFLERVSGARAVVGSLPFLDRPAFIHLLRKTKEKIVVALDCKDGRPTVRGWTEDAGAGDAVSVARDLAGLGVAALLVTDVARDGAMLGPNLTLLSAVRAVFRGEILASGGMRGPEDLGPVDAALSGGARGAIFGRALHAGATTVAALRSSRDGVAA